jgi:hypothetical protein
MRISSLRPIVALSAGLLAIAAQAMDVDSGHDAIGLAKALTSPQLSAFSLQLSSSSWVRLRGIDLNKVPETREALLTLRAKGIKTCVFLRLSAADWKRKYLPDDLREGYEQGRKLGAAFGDVVDAWEVDNEPDLGFVPESAERYTAFLKAMYLGIKAGAREQRSDGGRQTSDASQQPAGSLNSSQVSGFRSQVSGRAPLVLMGSLGLPPGPWLERFAANDGFAYTDGFNYHYYGYADDFTGVYHQHEAALKELTTDYTDKNISALSATSVLKKDLPVFMTEVGYGMLGKEARDTKEGRLRQWRWFKSVGEQLATLRPEAPMAFYLRPYLEYDTSEYGLTVRTKPAAGSKEHGARSSNPDDTSYLAGGIDYSPEDFGAEKAEPWMLTIGKQIGGNDITPALAQWLELRRTALSDQGSRLSGSATNNPQQTSDNHDGRRAWSVSFPRPSHVVIDFLPGVGLSHVKRYNGLFVTGREPPVHTNPETGRRLGADGEANLKPEDAKPKIPEPKPETPIPRSEEFILQVRTQNGNLYEVYPTRQATSDWQRFMEPGANFTMAFYGRAALPWRFKENKPASLVVVMYPKQLPATYEFRRPQLIKLGDAAQTQVSGLRSQVSPSVRYGQGTVVLYNFSDKPVTGHLELPSALSPLPLPPDPSANSASSVLNLLPGERREIPVSIKVPWDRYERIPVEITFVPAGQLSVGGDSLAGSGPNNPQPVTINPSGTVARFRTDLLPDLANRPTTLVADLLAQRTENRGQTTENGQQPNNQEPSTNNRDFVATRPRASEEAPMVEQSAESKAPSTPANSSDSLSPSPYALTAFAQSGATVERTTDGFAVTVSSIPAGRSQRIEVEIPWPDGLAFGEDEFLSLEFRLRP